MTAWGAMPVLPVIPGTKSHKKRPGHLCPGRYGSVLGVQNQGLVKRLPLTYSTGISSCNGGCQVTAAFPVGGTRTPPSNGSSVQPSAGQSICELE